MADQGLIQQFRNTFEGGLDTDTVSSFLKPNTYRDAQNLSMVTNGKFFSLMNVSGTTSFGTLPGVASNARIIGVFKNFYQIGTNSNIPCLTIFGYDNTNFKIWCFDTNAQLFYELYQEPKNSAMFQGTDKVIDAVAYAEYGYDDLYFTDNINEPRKIQCIIPNVYTPNFMTSTQIALAQRKAIGQISGVAASGGALLTGTYQLAYQLLVPSTNKYTRFSLLTNPIHIYTSDTIPKAGVGLPSSSKIVSTIALTDDEYASYTHFRIALVGNIFPEGATVQATNVVGLTKVESISSFYGGVIGGFNTISNYNILNNVFLNSTTIDEIVTDLAAIDYVKTLTVKRNRMLLGNINLKNLTYNNGTPSIGGGSIAKYSNSNTAIKDTFTVMNDSTSKRGHFRDEVYRYAISYFDKWGNYSSPKTLDMSLVQDNQISGSTDMKFPKRSFTSGGRYYTLLNGNDQTVSLGLNLTGITNHPTWAVGFIILRAKRKKNIIFQSPFIPMAHVYGLGALQQYPSKYWTYPTGSPTPVTVTSATPMGPSAVIMPPNLAFGTLVDQSQQPYYAVQGSSGATTTYVGEPGEMRLAFSISHAMVFPQDSMYTQLSPFVPVGNEQINSIDLCGVQCYFSQFNTTLPTACLYNVYADDSVSASYFAVQNNYMLNASGFTPGGGTHGVLQPTGYKFFDNLAIGTSLNGFSICDSSKLTTTASQAGPTTQSLSGSGVPQWSSSVGIGYTFNNQRYGIFELPGLVSNLNTPIFAYTFPALAATSTFQPMVSADGYAINQPQFGQSGSGLISVDPYGNNRAITNAIEIVNVVSNLQDNRYGATDAQNTFIFTGVQVNFTTSEITNYISQGLNPGGVVSKNVTVWGGDCFVGFHSFKVSETTWSITNPSKLGNPTYNGTAPDNPESGQVAIARYSKEYQANDSDNSPLHIPYFYKNHAQYITVPLESTYNGSVKDIDTPDVVTTQNTIPIYGAASEYKARAPMTYKYNINLNKENDQKIFVPLDPNIPIQTAYKARVMYSDVKVYQTLINGFDTFRVGNVYDYEERYGALTKLVLGGDNLYGLQQRAIFYIPINERVMEVTDASQLAVRSGNFISDPLYITNNKGCQHIRSVVQQGQFVLCADQISRQVFKIQGQDFEIVSDKGMVSKMQDNLTPTIYEDQLVGVYDYLKDEYWLINTGFTCYLYNDDYKLWTSNYQWPNNLFGGVYQNGQLWLVGFQSTGSFATGVQVHTMYTDGPGKLLGAYVTPSLSFVINPTLEASKTFDNLEINSTDRLSSLDIQVDREAALGSQNMVTESLLTIGTRGGEGGYMLKSLRDSTNARIRGLYANVTLKWQTNAVVPQVGISSVVSNSRLSAKIL